MLDTLFNSITSTQSTTLSTTSFLLCLAVSIILGAVIALSYMYKGRYSASFVVTLALLPPIVQTVIMLVNGNFGTAVAILGVFGLVRFRSVPGTAKEILSIFLSMTVGLATGNGCIGLAAVFTVVLVLLNVFYTAIKFGEPKATVKVLKIVIPESLEYTGLFDDLFEKYTKRHELVGVKSTNMGSLFKLDYEIELKSQEVEKEFIDEIRCRNGNLEISCNKKGYGIETL